MLERRVTLCRGGPAYPPVPVEALYALWADTQVRPYSGLHEPLANSQRPKANSKKNRENPTLDRYNNLDLATYQNEAMSGKSDFHVDISKSPRGE